MQHEQLFHIYIGTKYQGPQKALNEQHAIIRFANKSGKSRLIYRAEHASTVQQLKQPNGSK
jgi:hypothetical protein